MNTYSLYTRSAKLYVVEATSCDKAIARLALAAPGETGLSAKSRRRKA